MKDFIIIWLILRYNVSTDANILLKVVDRPFENDSNRIAWKQKRHLIWISNGVTLPNIQMESG